MPSWLNHAQPCSAMFSHVQPHFHSRLSQALAQHKQSFEAAREAVKTQEAGEDPGDNKAQNGGVSEETVGVPPAEEATPAKKEDAMQVDEPAPIAKPEAEGGAAPEGGLAHSVEMPLFRAAHMQAKAKPARDVSELAAPCQPHTSPE